MSVYMYLRCVDHDPYLYSDRIADHNWTEILAELFDAVNNREELIKKRKEWSESYRPFEEVEQEFGIFKYRSLGFLMDHPKCRIQVVDEYDKRYTENGRILDASSPFYNS